MLQSAGQQDRHDGAREMADLTAKQSRQGLAEVEAIGRAEVTFGVLARADIVNGRYALTFRPNAGRHPAPEQVLNELAVALNSKRYCTSDATGVAVRFEEPGAKARSARHHPSGA
jgi:hypothetical protein